MIRIERLFPAPTLGLVLFVTWLLMVRSLSPGQVLLGAFLAIIIPLLTRRFWLPLPRVKRPGKLVLFVIRVLSDIVVANLQVSLLILSPKRTPQPGFIEYPLNVSDRLAVTLLANTATMTPGTVSAYIRQDLTALFIHVLDMKEEESIIRDIHERYEKPIKEIFGC